MQLVQQNKEFLSIFAQLKPTNLRELEDCASTSEAHGLIVMGSCQYQN